MNNNNHKFFYIIPFSLNKPGGKSLGSRNKYKSLSNHFNVKLLSPAYDNIFSIAYFIVYVEIYICLVAIFNRSNKNIFFTRGVAGIFATMILKRTSNNLIIREVHAAPGEYRVIKSSKLKKFLIYLYEKASFFIDVSADFRVYNHPNLHNFYTHKGVTSSQDITLYNGATLIDSKLNKEEARFALDLDQDKVILAFTGSVSSWHNIGDLVSLQDEFDKNFDNIQIVIGGGKIPETPHHNIINIFPLNEMGCQNLIVSSDVCLLPVCNNRLSPGSPLKLYQYLLASRPVITQENIIGYADEVLKYNSGISIDFGNTLQARLKIINFIKNDLLSISMALKVNKSKMKITWDDRMESLSQKILSHPKIK